MVWGLRIRVFSVLGLGSRYFGPGVLGYMAWGNLGRDAEGLGFGVQGLGFGVGIFRFGFRVRGWSSGLLISDLRSGFATACSFRVDCVRIWGLGI